MLKGTGRINKIQLSIVKFENLIRKFFEIYVTDLRKKFDPIALNSTRYKSLTHRHILTTRQEMIGINTSYCI